jgi:hypothetical protein
VRNAITTIALLGFIWLIPVAFAQHGVAPNGYYPRNFNGDIFSGTVTKTGEDTVTLTFTKDGKEETFEGHLQDGCAVPRVDGSNRPMTAKEIPLNSKVTAFYIVHKVKRNGEKHREYEIIAISFDEYQGHKIPDDSKKAYSCIGSAFTLFKAFR